MKSISYRHMQSLLPLLLLVASPAFGEQLSAKKQSVLNDAERSQVEVRLDQPYAGNENPKQMVDVFLPKKRNSDKPLPVIVMIHGGAWQRGDRLDYASTGIQLARKGNYAAVGVSYEWR